MKKGAGFLVVSRKGTYLVCHATNQSHWSLPKGTVDDGETLFEAAKRELKEETGFTYPKDRGLPTLIGVSQYKHKKKKVYFYLLDNVKEFKPYCSSYVKGKNFKEIDKFLWATPEKARQLLHYSQKHLIPPG